MSSFFYPYTTNSNSLIQIDFVLLNYDNYSYITYSIRTASKVLSNQLCIPICLNSIKYCSLISQTSGIFVWNDIWEFHINLIRTLKATKISTLEGAEQVKEWEFFNEYFSNLVNFFNHGLLNLFKFSSLRLIQETWCLVGISNILNYFLWAFRIFSRIFSKVLTENIIIIFFSPLECCECI